MTDHNSMNVKFMSLESMEMTEPRPLISCAELYELDTITDGYEVIEKLKELGQRLPYVFKDDLWHSNDGNYIDTHGNGRTVKGSSV